MSEEFLKYCNEEVFVDVNIGSKYIHWFLIPSVLIIVILSFLDKRRNVKLDFLGGRPAPPRPLSFLDEARNRWGILCVFGSITGSIIGVVMKTFNASFPIWAKVFMIYILCLETSVVCYPLFVCMTTRHKLVGAISGLLYSLGWFAFEMFTTIQVSRCNSAFAIKTVNINAHMNLQEIPVMLCDFLLVLKFCHKLAKCIKKKTYKLKQSEQCKLCTVHHLEYVKNLLSKTSSLTNQEDSWRQLLKTRVLGSVPGFRYPISILAAVFMSSVMLYMVGLYCAETMEIFAKNNIAVKPFKDLLTAANVIATLVTFLCGIKNLCVFLKNYRTHMLSLYRGDRSFIPETVQSPIPNVHMARGMRFLGTAIVGTFWGTVFCYLIVFVPLSLVLMVFRLLKSLGKLNRLVTQFQWAIYPVCMIVIFQIQVMLIGRFLIQPKVNKKDKYKPLAVDNRSVYDILAFFFLFLNASIGLFTFLKRILVGAFMGVFLIPRMDRSLLIRGYEAMDKCYVNYIGMLMVDHAHNHPVLRVFCHVIKEFAEITWYSRSMQNTAENPIYSTVAAIRIPPNKPENTLAKRRWLLAYTLINNPGLAKDRRKDREPEEVDLRDIEYTESEEDEFSQQSCLRRKWEAFKRCDFKFPRNFSTNLVAMLVLLAFAMLYAGVPLLLEELTKEVEQLQINV